MGKRGFFRAYFNSRPSARGDIQSFGRCTSGHLFQFTPLREGRRPFVLCPSVDLLISIHAPPRGATRPAGHRQVNVAYFNSRPSARGDSPDTTTGRDNHISIHAPPRGATEWADFTGDFFRISIHAPPRGATAGRIDAPGFFDISIHAPPRGATGTGGRTASALDDFNSRPSARGDAQGDSARAEHCVHFNSRPSARGDRYGSIDGNTIKISIHAPPRGATGKRGNK